MFGIYAETHVDFHGLIELGELDFLEERNGLFQLVFSGFDLFARGLIFLAWLTCHITSLVQAVRIDTPDLPLSS